MPKQLWLDGIATKQGFVRQFVATPLGSGYSIEAQITGQEVTGGMQFLVVPSIRPRGDISVTPIILTGKRIVIPNLATNSTIRGREG